MSRKFSNYISFDFSTDGVDWNQIFSSENFNFYSIIDQPYLLNGDCVLNGCQRILNEFRIMNHLLVMWPQHSYIDQKVASWCILCILDALYGR